MEKTNISVSLKSDIIFDLSKEGLMHSKQTKEILSNGTRIMNISDEHPEILSRLKPEKIEKSSKSCIKCRNASYENYFDAGTDLKINMKKTIP